MILVEIHLLEYPYLQLFLDKVPTVTELETRQVLRLNDEKYECHHFV